MNQLLFSEIIHDLKHRFNLERWMRIFVIIGVILGSLLLNFVASQRLMTLLLAGLIGLGGVAIILRWPAIGILGVLVGGIFVPFSGPGGFNVSILGVALVFGLWILDMAVRQRKIEFVPSSTTIPIFVFMLSALISFGLGQLPWYPLAGVAPMDAQLGGLAISILSACAFLMVANQIKDIRWLKAITWSFVIIGGIYIAARLIPRFGQIASPFFELGAVAGSVFWVWLAVIPLSQAIYNDELTSFWRFTLFGLVIATFYVAVVQASGWKSGYIPPLAGAAVIIGLRMKRKVWFFVPIGIILAIMLLNEAIATDQYSYSTRLEAWQIVLEISKVNPITGLGFGNYRWYTPLFSIRGYYIYFNSHSQYVDIIAQTGLVGLACFAWVFWSVGKLGWFLRDRVVEGFEKAYVIGVIGGLAGTLVAGGFVDWILPFVYNIGMRGFRASILAWIFMGGLVSIEQITKQRAVSKSVG